MNPSPRLRLFSRTLSAIVFLPALCMALPGHANHDDSWLKFGGAARFNYAWRDYGPSSQFKPDLVQLNASGQYKNLFGAAQYRWYDGFDTVYYAYLGWTFANREGQTSDLRAGVVNVPFGLLPNAAHSAIWLGSGYYLGLDDDQDLGVVWQYQTGTQHWHVGLFTGDEYGDASRDARYSFDIATTPTLPYREKEQLNLRYEYTGLVGDQQWKLGASTRAGRLLNRNTRTHHNHLAGALHAELQRGPFTMQAQWAYYHYDTPEQRIAMGAFLEPFEIAAAAHVPSLNLAWEFRNPGWFDAITCYNDYSTVQSSGANLRDSHMNVTGCYLAKHNARIYLDWITARNMWYVGGPGIGIAEPGSGGWHSRLGINIGLYF